MRSKSSASSDRLDQRALQRLLDAGRTLVSELDVETVFERVLEAAIELTGAPCAALKTLDGQEHFLASRTDHPQRPEPTLGVPIRIQGEVWGNLYLYEQAPLDAV